MQETAEPRPRILVAEDSDEQRALYSEILRAAGYDVIEASDGDHALEAARTERLDLVIMDVTMPGRSGWNVLRVLRDAPETMNLPVIVVTGLAETWDRDASIAAGADRYLAKPVAPAAMLSEIRAILGR